MPSSKKDLIKSAKYGLPHRRLNPLNGDWVLVSPHRTHRPWLGKLEKLNRLKLPPYDPLCYLCPGNLRVNGIKNPDYQNTFVFTNDFQALLPNPPPSSAEISELLMISGVKGTCRVLCYAPRHDLTLTDLKLAAIENVIDAWIEQTRELSHAYPWIQVFENKGEMMGASNPHPHGQIWALNAVPNEPFKEDQKQLAYFNDHHRSLLIDYLAIEEVKNERIVIATEHWVVLVPFWATWPYETILIPRRNVPNLLNLNAAERSTLAKTLKSLLTKYDNLFEVPFPYSMGWHGSPFNGLDHQHWQLHAHFYPPLLRSATIRKFMVGYELLAEPQRDISPETSAEQLRKTSDRNSQSKKNAQK